jgi:hypothetical protein
MRQYQIVVTLAVITSARAGSAAAVAANTKTGTLKPSNLRMTCAAFLSKVVLQMPHVKCQSAAIVFLRMKASVRPALLSQAETSVFREV